MANTEVITLLTDACKVAAYLRQELREIRNYQRVSMDHHRRVVENIKALDTLHNDLSLIVEEIKGHGKDS